MAASGIPVSQEDTYLRNLKLLVEERDGRGATLTIGDRDSYLAEFLIACGRSLSADPQEGLYQYSEELIHARDVFIGAGLEALAPRASQTGNDWVQIGISLGEVSGVRSELCRRVSILSRQFLNDSLIDNFFFMNKPPGMRLRFQVAAGGRSAELDNVLFGELTCWRNDGLINYFEPGVYEPESYLFGGPRSMSFVHALFTLDSLIWLDYHACPKVEGAAISPAWLVSMAVLQTVFAGLGIIGWEDIGVWEHIRNMAGRRLGANKTYLPLYAVTSGQILDLWSHRERIIEGLHAPVKEIVVCHESGLITGASQWRSGYFCHRGASLGPRAAAAFYAIFHWNRAALSRTEQALLAESLANRKPENDRR